MSEAYTLLCRESDDVRQTTLLSENRLLEYTQEEAAGESLVGALFLGRVERVLPQIKAAFVKLGLAQNGFLPIREQESFHQANGPAPLLTGQDVLVQVKKDPKGEKGAFLTRDVILPGQYVLLMPMNHHVGVSKRIEGEEDHARARALGKKLSGGRIGVIVRHARELNAFAIGEDNARHVGVNVRRVKLAVLVTVSVLIGVCVSISGSIGFVGLVVPHAARMIAGPNHRRLLPASMFAGAIFLLLADLIARTLLSPVELSIGVVTSLVGAVAFVVIFYRARKAG